MPPSALKNKGYIALFLTSTLWGTTWVVSKVGIREIPALQLTAIRQFVAGLCFVLFFMVVKKYPLPNRYQLRRMFIVCLFMFVAANGLSTWGLNYIPTGLGALIGALYPLSVVLIERIFYKGRKILPLTLVGFLLGVTGMVIVFYENIRLTGNSLFLFGLALSIIAMLSWSLGTIFVTRKTFTINPYYGIGWQMLMSSVVLLGMSFLLQDPVPVSTISWKGWASVLYLVGIGSIVAFAAFIYSTKKLPMAIASLYAYINPLVAMLLAAWWLDEKLTVHILYGAAFTLLGVFLVNYSVRKADHKKTN